MRKDIGLSFIFILITGMVFLKAQEPTDKIEDEQKLMEYINKINSFNNLYPQEKVYLHFDNTGYFKGEAIWFKAWVVTSEENSYSPLSKVLYVELLTPEGDIVETKKLKVVNGQADGGFILDEKLFTGFYEVRAYTKCMLNFGEETVFSRVFPVFDPPKTAGNYTNKEMTVRGPKLRVTDNRKDENKKSGNVNMLFFPEGGNIIQGIDNRIAFKATGKEGQALDIKGKIYDNNNREITAFETVHLGMGSFEFVPGEENYTAIIEYNGKKYTFNLPQPMPSGYTMRVDNTHPEKLYVTVNKTKGLPSSVLGISFACRGKVYAYNAFSVDNNGQFTMRITKESLPSGVIQVTLFTEEGNVLSKRQLFINHNRFLPIKITGISESIEPFGPVNINFNVTGTGNNPIQSSFSLSVKDADSEIGSNNTDNIMYNMLLGSDLKGYIEDPAFYFTDIDNKKIEALDLLMMTQGWTRYPWKKMTGLEPFEVKYGIEDRLIIEGRVLSAIKAKPEQNVDVAMWMFSPYGSSQQGKCITDKDGYFNFGLSDIYGRWDMTLVTKKKNKRENTRITLNRTFSPQPSPYSFYQTRLGYINKQNNIVHDTVKIIETNHPSQRLNMENDNITLSYILDEITIMEKTQRTIKSQGLRYANIIYDIQDEVDKIRDKGGSETTNVLDFLERTNEYFRCLNGSCRYKQYPVVFYLDLKIIPMSGGIKNERNIGDLDISQIENIMIAENDPTVSIELKGNDGVGIYIYTNEDGRKRKETRGTRQTRFYGYSAPMEFYSPDYTYERLPEEKDFRRTLYWNPNVETDKDGNAMVSFFNNGKATDINISAEGLTNEGIPIIFCPY